MKIKEYKEQYPGLYYFDTFTFTTLGTSGSRGPDVTKGYANAPWRDGDFYIQDGQQHWTVPANGVYQITAAGAYGAAPGRVVTGQVKLNQGQDLTMLVGQCPSQLTSNVQDNVTVGGGGGTFVVTDKPLIVASGGDGGSGSNVYTLENTLTFANYVTSTLSSDGTTTATASGSSVSVYRGYTLQSTLGVTAAASNNGFYKSIDLSSDGNALSVCTSDGKLLVYKFVNGAWTSTQIGTLANAVGTSISSDGTVVMFMTSTGDAYAYVYSGGTWTSTYINPLYTGNPGNVVSVSLSGNGNVGIICTRGTSTVTTYQLIMGQLTPVTTSVDYSNVYSVSKTVTTWSLQAVFPSVFSVYPGGPMCSVNYNGTIAAVLSSYNGQVQICNYSAGSWSNTLLVAPIANFYNRGLALNSSGDTLAFMLSSGNLNLYKYSGGSWSLAYTVSNTTGDTYFGSAISINSSTNKIVTRGQYSVYTITYPLPQSGKFSPPGTGAGYSGAGYLTDGQCTDPYFGFLTPKAYMNGGFGNVYEYGVVAEQGGFGGGQSAIGIRTALTNITGSSNIYPNQNGHAVCLSLDGTVALVALLSATVTVYKYSSGWDTGTVLYNNTAGILSPPYYVSKIIALSQDGNTALVSISNRVYAYKYSGGSWGSATSLLSTFPSLPTVALNSDGTKAFVCYYDGGTLDANARVYTYSGGSWDSGTELPWTTRPKYIRVSSMSSDGTTAAYIENDLGIVSIFKYSGGTWSLSKKITGITQTEFSLSISSNGNTLLFGRQPYVDVLKYSGGTWTTQTLTNTSVNFFGQTVSVSPDGTYYYIGSEVNVFIYKNDALYKTINITSLGDIASSTSIFAYSTSKYPGTASQVIFGNVNQFTTTCTANTSIAHGYPHNYKVKITGTNIFNGTWDITTTSSNTFTFQAFGGPTETSGYVSGTVTGVSGGGGYSGSLGDGVTSATCYADVSVSNFTDLGASSNTAGYITVSLVDPKPLTETWSWDDESPWENVNTFTSNTYSITWNESLGLFISASVDGPYIGISSDGKNWTNPVLTGDIDLYNPSGFEIQLVSATNKPIIVWGQLTSENGTHWTYNNLPYMYYPQTNYLNNMFLVSSIYPPHDGYGIYTSSDGRTWSLVSPTFTGIVRAYKPSVYVGMLTRVYSYDLGYSYDLQTWIPTGISSITDVTYGNGVFVAVGLYGIYTSQDGIQWTSRTLPPNWLLPTYGSETIKITFGNNLFIIFGPGVNVFISQDGIQWTFSTSLTNTYNFPSVAYSPSLGFFLVNRTFFIPLATLEGRYFTPFGTFFKEPIMSCAWSNELRTLALISGSVPVYSQTSWPIYIYTSFDEGQTWSEKLLLTNFTTYDLINIHIVWSSELGLFFIYAASLVNNTILNLNIFTSSDGITWNSYNSTLNAFSYGRDPSFYCLFDRPIWSKQKGIFTNARFLSRDGINWSHTSNTSSIDQYIYGVFPNTITMETTNISVQTYSEKLGIFLASCYVYNTNNPSGYSYDGSNWFSLPYKFSSITWSPQLGLFIGITASYLGVNSSIYSSTDGINWNKVTDIPTNSYTFSFVVWSNELQKFYLLILNTDTSQYSLQASKDGYVWVATAAKYPLINTGHFTGNYPYNFFWFSGLDRFIIQTYPKTFSGITFSPKALKQF